MKNVNITIKNSKSKVIANKTVKTNDKWIWNWKREKYVVLVVYGGNENYTGNNTTQKLTIKEEIVKTDSSVSSTASSDEYSLEGP